MSLLSGEAVYCGSKNNKDLNKAASQNQKWQKLDILEIKKNECVQCRDEYENCDL